MKNIFWNADKVTLRFDSAIRWLGEAYLDGRRRLPQVFFNESTFCQVEMKSNHIDIDIMEWTLFFHRLTSVFRDNHHLRYVLGTNINERLARYRETVTHAESLWRKKARFLAVELQHQFQEFGAITAFSLFNVVIPVNWYLSIFKDLGVSQDVRVDDFLISMIVPHRIQLRRAKLNLALEIARVGQPSEISLRDFQERFAPFEFFERWCFDDSRLTDNRLLLREIREIVRCSSPAEIEAELAIIEDNHLKSLRRRQRSMALVAKQADFAYSPEQVRNLLESLAFLSHITTQEEIRHMMQVQHLIVFGRAIRALQLDVAQSTIENILFAARGRWSL